MSQKMRASEVSASMAEKLGISKKASHEAHVAFGEVAVAGLKAGKDICVAGFGILKAVTRAARECRNLHTGEKITVPPKRTVKVSISAETKRKLNS